ncbi:MAG: hypothetical protein K2Y51_09320 [Gammaproteobacteria bacterium]|nr:hypothetical protein [Gammaproteobacteria bacterium]
MSALLDQIAADAGAVFLTDFAETVTIAGVPRQAIVIDDFEQADPRAPVLKARTVDLDGVAAGAAVVVRGVTYALEYVRPGRFGVSEAGLRR